MQSLIEISGEIFIWALLLIASFLWGCIFMKWKSDGRSNITLGLKNISENPQVSFGDSNKTLTIIKKKHFCEFEKRFLIELIQKNKLSVAELNNILHINKLTSDNQRQRRHVFLKDLNLKLSIIFEIPEPIMRIENPKDKRAKIYCLDNTLNHNSILKIL